MKRSALCLVDTEAQADVVVEKLRSAGFSDNDISVLFPDKGSTRDFAHKKETKCLKVRRSEPVREVSLEAPLDCWPVLEHWPYLAWAHSSQQDLLWRRSAAAPLVLESVV